MAMSLLVFSGALQFATLSLVARPVARPFAPIVAAAVVAFAGTCYSMSIWLLLVLAGLTFGSRAMRWPSCPNCRSGRW